MSRKLKEAHRKLTERVMGRAGIVGTAIGQRNGKSCLTVYVRDSDAGGVVPGSVDGIRVVVEKSGGFRRL